MTDPYLSTRSAIPGQRSDVDHPMRPDVAPQLVEPAYATGFATPRPAAIDEPYASWGLRVAAVLMDLLAQVPFAVAYVIGIIVAFDGGGLAWVDRDGFSTLTVTAAQVTTTTWIGLAVANVAGLAGAIFSIWNSIFRQGRRGASIGKQCMNLMVVSERDGRPIGALMTLIRSWAHLLDLVTLGIGYLWPLWDRKHQTLHDKLVGSVVVQV